MLERKVGADNTMFAWCLNDLAIVNERLGDYEAARRLQERSLAIKTKLLGPDHPDVGAALNNLCVLSWRMKDYRQAVTLCERALAIREKTLGPEHDDVAGTLENLGLAYQGLAENARARQCYDRALAISEKKGKESGGVLLNLASLHEQMRQYPAAAIAYGRALRIFERAAEPPTHDIADALFGAARVASATGDRARASSLYERLVPMVDQLAEGDRNLALEILEKYRAMLGSDPQNGKAAAVVEAKAAELRSRK